MPIANPNLNGSTFQLWWILFALCVSFQPFRFVFICESIGRVFHLLVPLPVLYTYSIDVSMHFARVPIVAFHYIRAQRSAHSMKNIYSLQSAPNFIPPIVHPHISNLKTVFVARPWVCVSISWCFVHLIVSFITKIDSIGCSALFWLCQVDNCDTINLSLHIFRSSRVECVGMFFSAFLDRRASTVNVLWIIVRMHSHHISTHSLAPFFSFFFSHFF